MPRPPRLTYADALHHVTLRCNNREFLFEEPWFAHFTALLQEARKRFPMRLYHYCVMTNHVHLFLQVGRDDTLPAAMHWLSSTFVGRFNRARGRCGHLWEGRYRSALVESSSYFFRCMAYVDLNPVRAGIVSTPGKYPWSGHNALRREDGDVLDIHPLYTQLGSTCSSRYERYSELLAAEAAKPAVSLARVYFVGGPRFIRRMAERFGFGEGRHSVRHVDVGSGVVCVMPAHGLRLRSK